MSSGAFASSGEELSLIRIWEWYEETEQAINLYQQEVINGLISGKRVSETFSSMTRKEVKQYFSDHKKELEHIVSLNIIASTEASLRVDYLRRALRGKRKKNKIDNKFKELYEKKGTRVSLRDEILEAWKEVHPDCTEAIGDFRGALNVRDWLAHGRYWIPRFGRKYNAILVFNISKNLFENFPYDFSWAIK
jgi:hypothetical protein